MTPELAAKLAGRRVVASVSGGKDSAALSLWLKEQGIEHDRVFMDTGWEHPATYEYLRGELTRVIGPITEIRNEEQMVQLSIKKGMFPSRNRRWCTDLLKIGPLKRHLEALAPDGVSAVGIRAEESAARATYPEWEWSKDLDRDVWRPLLSWSLDDVIATHRRHGLAPNPLYTWGAERVGCWPCIFAVKSELRLLGERDPDRVKMMSALEAEVTESARAIVEARGETLEHDRTWFQSRIAVRGPDGSESYPPWPIERVMSWARTARGGKQFELFAAPASETGCMRWGLCETSGGTE